MARTDEEFRTLERSLAYECATSAIDCATMPVYRAGPDDDPDVDWCDLASENNGTLTDETLAAIDYLEWRGLIQHDVEHPEWISFRPESEATR